MRKIVFDIETNSYNFETLSESQQEYLLRYVEKERDEQLKEIKREEAIRYMSLYPFTSKVIVIGLLDIESEKRVIYYEDPSGEEWNDEENKVKYIPSDEKGIIKAFWKIMGKTEQIITFNGKCFDVPFILIRSAIMKVKPTRNLITTKYDKFHIDLQDQLTFYGATRKFNLDFYCQSLGITSPKSGAVTGMNIKEFYESDRMKEIASYCGNDIWATYELYKIWNEYLNI